MPAKRRGRPKGSETRVEERRKEEPLGGRTYEARTAGPSRPAVLHSQAP